MTDIKCCSCNEWTRGVERLLEGGYYTVQSGFTKSAGESCDNCGHDFCEDCEEFFVVSILSEVEP